jgi:D-alanyl-D-alanine carboxypeptidase
MAARSRHALKAVLDRVVAEGLRDPRSPRGAPGITAAVVTPDGYWTDAAGTGGDMHRMLVPQAMMAIGSITKTFTAAEVLQLTRPGLIALDKPASNYLDHPLLARKPTVRQLLCMTSGIPEHTNDLFFQKVLAEPERHWSAQAALTYAKGNLRSPGKAYQYSNSNYLLLGLLIEKVTGLTYATALRRDLLSIVGPGRLAVQDGEAPAPPLVAPGRDEGVRPDGQFLPNRSAASAAGAAGSIAADALTLARWGYNLYGGRLLAPDAVRTMATPCQDDYGLGTVIMRLPRQRVAVGHDGSIPGYSAFLLVIPERQLALAILFPRSDVDSYGLTEELVDAALSLR